MIARWIALVALTCSLAFAADLKPDEARDQAVATWKAGKRDEAFKQISDAISQHPKDSRLLHVRAQMRLALKDGKGALNDLDEAIKLADDSGFLRQERAQLRFKAGLIQDAVADFDKANELNPSFAPRNWQRGIALYYAGRFADGRKQFEIHRTVNPEDVENAAWHFLCAARADGIESAKKSLISVERDSRVPMREVQRLFAGQGTVDDVFAAARGGQPSAADLRNQEFYAHLYVGLHFEALGDATKAKEHIFAAAKSAPADDYMGDVARVHAALLKLAETNPPKP